VVFTISEAGRAIADESDSPFQDDSATNREGTGASGGDPDAGLPPALRRSDAAAEPPPLPGEGRAEEAPPIIGAPSGAGQSETSVLPGVEAAAEEVGAAGLEPADEAGLPPALREEGAAPAELGVPGPFRDDSEAEERPVIGDPSAVREKKDSGEAESATDRRRGKKKPASEEVRIDATHGDKSALERMQQLQKKEVIRTLREKDRDVRSAEYAKVSMLGKFRKGGPRFRYETGPDGQRYAIEGNVPVDLSPAESPENSIRKARKIKNASLGVGEVSDSDRKVAAQAQLLEMQARAKIARDTFERISDEDGTPPVGMRSNDDVSLAAQAKHDFEERTTLKPGEFEQKGEMEGLRDDEGDLKNPIFENELVPEINKIEQNQFEHSYLTLESDEEEGKDNNILDLFA
jgi:hypothetical protein